MIVGYHVIVGAYGFWLPNDPRGSWSKFVGSLELFYAAGRSTKTGERNVFLDEEDLARAINYVEQNPVKQGLRKQRWNFVQRIL